jgi:hypothetical protein
MAQRTVSLMSTLLELHKVHEPAELLPLLLDRTAPEFGAAAAVCYLLDARTGNFRLEYLADTEGTLTLRRWEDELQAPIDLPHALAMPALSQLAAADPVTLTGPLATLLAGFWPGDTADQLQQALGVRFAAAAPIWMAQGPIGLVVLLLKEQWPVATAAECAAHSAAALARLFERRGAVQADSTPLMRDVIEQIASRELNRADRYGRVISIAVFEPEGEGETSGPQIDLAALVAHVMRQPDTVGHLDQRRVIALLPETPAEGAEVFRRRLHRAARSEILPLYAGTATFPTDGKTLAELLHVAESRRQLLTELPETASTAATATSPAIRGRGQPAAPEEPSAAVEGPTVRVRVAPLAEVDLLKWKLLLERLPAALSVEPCGFDGFAAMFDLRAPTVTRLLTDLQKLAQKIGAELTPTITGEVGLTLKAAEAPAKSAAAGRVKDFQDAVAASHGRTEAPERAQRADRPSRASQPSGRPRRLRRAAVRLSAGVAAVAVLAAAGFGVRSQLYRLDSPEPQPARVDRRVVRDLDGRCLPEPGAAACDPLREGLWSGDLRTWQEWMKITGGPALDAAGATDRTITMRLAVYDPGTRIGLAQAEGRPLPIIAAVGLQSTDAGEQIVALELANLGVVEADLAGMMLPGGLGRIAARSILKPGDRCTIGPGAAGNACRFSLTSGEFAAVIAGDHLLLSGADGAVLDDYVMP